MYNLKVRSNPVLFFLALAAGLAAILYLPEAYPERLIEIPLATLYVGELGLALMLALLFFENATIGQVLRLAACILGFTMLLGAVGNAWAKTTQFMPGSSVLMSWVELIAMNAAGALVTVTLFRLYREGEVETHLDRPAAVEQPSTAKPAPAEAETKSADGTPQAPPQAGLALPGEVGPEDFSPPPGPPPQALALPGQEAQPGPSAQELIDQLDVSRINRLEESLRPEKISLETLFREESQAARLATSGSADALPMSGDVAPAIDLPASADPGRQTASPGGSTLGGVLGVAPSMEEIFAGAESETAPSADEKPGGLPEDTAAIAGTVPGADDAGAPPQDVIDKSARTAAEEVSPSIGEIVSATSEEAAPSISEIVSAAAEEIAPSISEIVSAASAEAAPSTGGIVSAATEEVAPSISEIVSAASAEAAASTGEIVSTAAEEVAPSIGEIVSAASAEAAPSTGEIVSAASAEAAPSTSEIVSAASAEAAPSTGGIVSAASAEAAPSTSEIVSAATDAPVPAEPKHETTPAPEPPATVEDETPTRSVAEVTLDPGKTLRGVALPLLASMVPDSPRPAGDVHAKETDRETEIIKEAVARARSGDKEGAKPRTATSPAEPSPVQAQASPASVGEPLDLPPGRLTSRFQEMLKQEKFESLAQAPEISAQPPEAGPPEVKEAQEPALFDEKHVDSEVDEVFKRLVPKSAQREVSPEALKRLRGEEVPVAEDSPLTQALEGKEGADSPRPPATSGKGEKKKVVLPEAQGAKELKEFGRLSASTPAADGGTTGAMKTIGKMLIDPHAVENIIKAGEQRGPGLARARIVSAAQGQDLHALLEEIGTVTGAEGSVLVGDDGLLIAASGGEGFDGESIGTLALAIQGSSAIACDKAEMGALRQLILISKNKLTLVTSVPGGILATLLSGSRSRQINTTISSVNAVLSKGFPDITLPALSFEPVEEAGPAAPFAAEEAEIDTRSPECAIADNTVSPSRFAEVEAALSRALESQDPALQHSLVDEGASTDQVVAEPQAVAPEVEIEEAASGTAFGGGPATEPDTGLRVPVAADLVRELIQSLESARTTPQPLVSPTIALPADASPADGKAKVELPSSDTAAAPILALPAEAPPAAPPSGGQESEDAARPLGAADVQADVVKPAEIKEFGRLSRKASASEPQAGETGTMKTIGKMLIDEQVVANIIKAGESRTGGLTTARVISAARGEGIRSLLKLIDGYPGVAGSLIVGHDGLVIVSTLPPGVDKDVLGAMCTAIHSSSNLATAKLEQGRLRQTILESEDTTTVLTEVEVGVLAVFWDSKDRDKLDGLLKAIEETIHG